MNSMLNFVAELMGGTPAPKLGPGGKPLRAEGMLTKDEALEFFRLVESGMDTSEYRTAMRSLAESGRDPVDAIEKLQTDSFVSMGIDPKHGAACLGKLIKVYSDDKAFCEAVYEHAAKEEAACQRSEASEAQAMQMRAQQEAMSQAWNCMSEADRRAQMEQRAMVREALSKLTPEQQQAMMMQQQQAMMQLMQRIQGLPPAQQQAEVMAHQQAQTASLLGSQSAALAHAAPTAQTAAPMQQTM